MIHNNRKTSGLVLIGLAAFAYYRYKRMTADERTDLINTVKEKAQGLWDHFMPGGLKNTVANTGDNKTYSDTVM